MRSLHERGGAIAPVCACALMVLGVGCLPPTPIGHIVRDPQPRGAVFVSAQGGISATHGEERVAQGRAFYGAAHLEVFVTPQWSIPMTVAYGQFRDIWFNNPIDYGYKGILWGAMGRLGMRYRMEPGMTVGAGISGGGYRKYEYWDDPCCPEDHGSTYQRDGDVHLDFEWSVGKRWKHVSLSLALRLVWNVRWVLVGSAVTEAGFVFYPGGGSFGITATVFFGCSELVIPWGGVSGGITFRL